MKVHIGKYLNYYGPYQIAEFLLFWKDKDKDDIVHKLGTYLAEDKYGNDSWITKVCQWCYALRKRKIKVRIDPWDTWSADDTLCYIIHPLIKQLKEDKHGYGRIDKEDVPEYLNQTFHDDGYSEAAYNWVLDEIIWGFDPEWEDKYGLGIIGISTQDYMSYLTRQRNAQRLFGKYYCTFWD